MMTRWQATLGSVVSAAAILLLVNAPTHALMVKRSVGERVQEADYIVAGTVTEQASHWHPRHAMLVTDVTLRITEDIKGPQDETPPSTIIVRVPGGQRGNVRMLVSDVPRFEPSQRHLLFLKASSTPGRCRIVHGSEGAVRLITDPVSGQEIIDPEAAQSLVQDFRLLPATRGFAVSTAAQPTAAVPLTLAECRRQLKALVQSTASQTISTPDGR
jgi:hypothetical protein